MGNFDLRKYLAENKLHELEASDVNVKNDAENIMKEFIQAVEKSPNSKEIFEKFENWVNSFMPGAIKENSVEKKGGTIEYATYLMKRSKEENQKLIDLAMKDLHSPELKKALEDASTGNLTDKINKEWESKGKQIPGK